MRLLVAMIGLALITGCAGNALTRTVGLPLQIVGGVVKGVGGLTKTTAKAAGDLATTAAGTACNPDVLSAAQLAAQCGGI